MNLERIKTVILGIVLLLMILTAVFIDDYYDTKEQLYVPGKFYKIEYVYRSGDMAFYRYNLNGKTYKGFVKYYVNRHKIDFDKTYFVKVPKGFPSEGQILLDSIVPN